MAKLPEKIFKLAPTFAQIGGVVLTAVCCLHVAHAAKAAQVNCVPPSAKLTPSQIEAQFCAADAVFTGEVEAVTKVDEFDSKLVDAYQARSRVRMMKVYKGNSSDTAIMVASIKEPGSDYFFKNNQQYLIFAHKLVANEYTSATAKCSAQYAVEIAQADSVLKRLEQNASGARKINCEQKPSQKAADSKPAMASKPSSAATTKKP